jgi:hypothetical protein
MFRGRKDIVCPYLHEMNEIDILCCNAGGGTLLVQAYRHVYFEDFRGVGMLKVGTSEAGTGVISGI